MKLLFLALVSVVAVSQAEPNEGECLLCKLLYHAVVGEINADKPIIKDDLEKVCVELGPLQTACVQFVEAFFDQGLADAENWESINKLCVEQLNVCVGNKVNLQDVLMKGSSLMNKDGNIGCSACNGAVDGLRYFLTQPWIQNQLKSKLISLCGLLTQDQQQCVDTVTNYMSNIVSYLLTEVITQQNICTNLFHISNCAPTDSNSKNDERWGLDLCGMLQQIINDSDSLITQLAGVCTAIPDPSLSSTCTETFQNNRAQIKQIIFQAAQSIANAIPFISCKLTPASGFVETVGKSGGFLCPMCMSLVPKLKEAIANGNPDAALKNWCQHIGWGLQHECQQLGNLVLMYLEAYIDHTPKEICENVGACSARKAFAVSATSIKCTLCTDFFNDIKNVITDPTTQQEIVAAIVKNCKLIPNTEYQATCTNVITNYSATLFTAIAGFLNPTSVCPKFHLCPSS